MPNTKTKKGTQPWREIKQGLPYNLKSELPLFILRFSNTSNTKNKERHTTLLQTRAHSGCLLGTPLQYYKELVREGLVVHVSVQSRSVKRRRCLRQETADWTIDAVPEKYTVPSAQRHHLKGWSIDTAPQDSSIP